MLKKVLRSVQEWKIINNRRYSVVWAWFNEYLPLLATNQKMLNVALPSRVGNRVEIKWLQWVLSKREDTPSPPGRVRPPEEESDGLNDTNVCKLFLRNPHLCLSKNNFYVRVYLYWKSGRSVCWGKKQMAATLHQSGTPASNAVECDSMPCPFRRSRFVIMPLLRW